MDKSKIAVAITIGLMSFMMVYIMLIQFNTVKEYDGEEIELMRETELKETLATYKEKYEETNNQLIDTKTKIEEYKKDEQSEEDAIALLEDEVKEANMLLGKTDVEGEGIIITIGNPTSSEDEDVRLITSEDLVELVNELRMAGAEAISINGKRIVANSDIFVFDEYVIYMINGERTTEPFTVKAIGDIKYLESALSIKGGYIDKYTLNGYDIKLETQSNITIGKYEKDMTLDYAKTN